MLAVASESLGALLAIVSGVSFALIGIAYKIGQPRGVIPAQIMMIMCAIGACVFGTQCGGVNLAAVPAYVWIVGVIVGVTQWMALQLVSVALRQGPLSGAWCAISLSFLLVFPYAFAIFDKAPRPLQLGSALLAALCVVSASLNQGAASRDASAKPSGEALSGAAQLSPKPGYRFLSYCLLLVALLLVNGVLGVGQYDLSQRKLGSSTLLESYQSVFYTVLYVTITTLLFLQLLLRRRLNPRQVWMWALGAMAGLGSVSGLYNQGLAAGSIGPVAYAIGGAAGLVCAGVVGAAAFKEKPTVLWYATILLGVLAVVTGYL